MQPPGSMARETQPRVQRSYSQGARANATGNADGQSSGSRRVAPRWGPAPFAVEYPQDAGPAWLKFGGSPPLLRKLLLRNFRTACPRGQETNSQGQLGMAHARIGQQ